MTTVGVHIFVLDPLLVQVLAVLHDLLVQEVLGAHAIPDQFELVIDESGILTILREAGVHHLRSKVRAVGGQPREAFGMREGSE